MLIRMRLLSPVVERKHVALGVDPPFERPPEMRVRAGAAGLGHTLPGEEGVSNGASTGSEHAPARRGPASSQVRPAVGDRSRTNDLAPDLPQIRYGSWMPRAPLPADACRNEAAKGCGCGSGWRWRGSSSSAWSSDSSGSSGATDPPSAPRPANASRSTERPSGSRATSALVTAPGDRPSTCRPTRRSTRTSDGSTTGPACGTACAAPMTGWRPRRPRAVGSP